RRCHPERARSERAAPRLRPPASFRPGSTTLNAGRSSSEPIPDEARADREQRYRDYGRDCPPRLDRKGLTGLGDHQAPVRRRGWRAEAEEAQPGDERDRVSEAETCFDGQWAGDIRKDLP